MNYQSNFELESSLDASISLPSTIGYIIHSLRMPLNSIEASCNILLSSNIGEEDRKFAKDLILRVYNYFEEMLSKIKFFEERRIKLSKNLNIKLAESYC